MKMTNSFLVLVFQFEIVTNDIDCRLSEYIDINYLNNSRDSISSISPLFMFLTSSDLLHRRVNLA